MADLRTTVTELITGLGTLAHDSVAGALTARPTAMASVAPTMWNQLELSYAGGALGDAFEQAFANGQAFLHAADGLRGRIPTTVEWKGSQLNPGDDALPVDLRIDHVYLVSCKYLSKILHNAAPSRLFDNCLRRTDQPVSRDWYAETAPDEYQRLYSATRTHCGATEAPAMATELTTVQRRALKDHFPPIWPDAVEEAYQALCATSSRVTAERWRSRLQTPRQREEMLWRILRFGPAPYFVLGTSPKGPLRLRIATPWDWRQQFQLMAFDVNDKPGGQPMVAWRAAIKDRHSGVSHHVEGHVEIRWSHGRFGGAPEAKIYLDTPHDQVPGYFALR